MQEPVEVSGKPVALPVITYPEDLPVSARRNEIAAAIESNQVVIVSGETGSGKTTQIPKICLEMGRGLNKTIGHTQPRRLAATSVARRIAEELNTEIGDLVGYQIRFADRTGSGTAIKLMTDGILLAESQRDPLLRRYDTIIIDEAHERSLNIDFLLGFLKQLLVKRKDLKLIITSATIDAKQFSEHFATHGKAAPVIEVSGRLYPVEVLYRPVLQDKVSGEDDTENSKGDERDLNDAIVDAVAECARYGPGDILVFLPGEREIREATEALRKQPLTGTEILPLYARLSNAEQESIFKPKGNARRIVLATNVAETSLTVPGIRFVVDSGLARIKRYSWRNKVEQLRIEPVSQASANQRAGRCGRIGPGVCIRLYAEDDFKQRAPFSDPEILRSSLAGVILRMKALRLNDIEQFPFVDAPSGRAIADGYQLLQELGALDEGQRLTKVGQELSRLPVDPRIARMILAARDQQCLHEMLIIASALSVQDPRERPMHDRDAAERAHQRFVEPQSEFLSFVKMWDWYGEQVKSRLSHRKLSALLRQSFLSPMRFREWREVHKQLLNLVRELEWRSNTVEATYEQIHCALLTGLIANVGHKTEEAAVYQGTRDIRFVIHPGSTLGKKAGRWVLAGELVETSRLFARCLARIEPVWIEKVAGHLLKKTWSDPRWERRAGQVVANERASLYGLPVYSGRRLHYGRINPVEAREIFIRDALVAGEINSDLPFLKHNRQQISAIEKLEHQSRRPDILIDDALIYAFYDSKIPPDISQTASLEKWFKGLNKTQAAELRLNRDDLMRHDAAGITTDVFPRRVEWDGVNMALDYHFEPGSVRDGVTLTIPLYHLNKIDAERCEWLVPGMLKEKVQWLLRSLPQRLRRHCVPIPEYAAGFHERWFEKASHPTSSLIDAIINDVWQERRQRLQSSDFKPETLPPHLYMNFKVVDEHGRMLSGGRNLEKLRAEHGKQAQESFQRIASTDQEVAKALDHEKITSWSFGELPELLEIRRGGRSVIGYPALVDKKDSCDLDVFDDPELALRTHRAGLRRLFRIALKEQVRFQEKNIPDLTKMALLYMPLGTQEELRDQIVDAAIDAVCLVGPLPTNAESFAQHVEQARPRLGLLTQEIARQCALILAEWSTLQRKLPTIKSHTQAYEDMRSHQSRLMHKFFLRENTAQRLAHFPRYLKAAQSRIDKLRADPGRDARWMSQLLPLQTLYLRSLASAKGAVDPKFDDFRWMLEELRVSLFAQELRTPMPISAKRLERAWAAMQR
ncbi:ATP-dependent RNA helicase HrpA [Paenalcaligenes niemegkensis]|uniref:ATP-dependent RNA helicase HrpA n=1 Tax=Paenalcaligenes niemegkensis TaxID=2895469 RepID=UPI001EE986FF|nr:ATP-dependent RNA helicase HrpA [Paenalcaligenes niemegkensis]MCQ9615617.1 ATP-dependent RNA helicase HrpA [Paenalcaligenes niemegkensis]